MGRVGEATGTHTAATLRCTQAPLHQWQFTRGRNRHTHPQTVMKRELEKHPTEQMKQEEGQATALQLGVYVTPSNDFGDSYLSEIEREQSLRLQLYYQNDHQDNG